MRARTQPPGGVLLALSFNWASHGVADGRLGRGLALSVPPLVGEIRRTLTFSLHTDLPAAADLRFIFSSVLDADISILEFTYNSLRLFLVREKVWILSIVVLLLLFDN